MFPRPRGSVSALVDESAIEAARLRGDTDAVARQVMRAYGPEILSWLRGVLDPAEADEVFGAFAEGMWRALPRFAGRSSYRTWCYAIARRSMSMARRTHARARVRPGGDDRWSELAAEVRTATSPWLKTEVKDAFRRLRDALPLEERTLLVLRVDRGMEWAEIAEIWAAEDALDEAARRRLVAGLRKRFERVKARLREQAEAEGLLPER